MSEKKVSLSLAPCLSLLRFDYFLSSHSLWLFVIFLKSNRINSNQWVRHVRFAVIHLLNSYLTFQLPMLRSIILLWLLLPLLQFLWPLSRARAYASEIISNKSLNGHDKRLNATIKRNRRNKNKWVIISFRVCLVGSFLSFFGRIKFVTAIHFLVVVINVSVAQIIRTYSIETNHRAIINKVVQKPWFHSIRFDSMANRVAHVEGI